MINEMKTLPETFKSICALMLKVTAQIRTLRFELAKPILPHLSQALLMRCPAEHTDFLSEMVYAFAGVISSLKEKGTEDGNEGRIISAAEYEVRLESNSSNALLG